MTGVRIDRRNSWDIAGMRMRRSGGGRPTARWQDKSREVRGGRSGEERTRIRPLARCAPLRDSLSARTSPCKHTHDCTSRMSPR
jgi:hypothetical protein